MSRYLIPIVAFALLSFEVEANFWSWAYEASNDALDFLYSPFQNPDECGDGTPWMDDNGYYLRPGGCHDIQELANGGGMLALIWQSIYNSGYRSYYSYTTGCATEVDECFGHPGHSTDDDDCEVVFPGGCDQGTWTFIDYDSWCGDWRQGHYEEFRCGCWFTTSSVCHEYAEKSGESAVAGESENVTPNLEETLRVLGQGAENPENLQETLRVLAQASQNPENAPPEVQETLRVITQAIENPGGTSQKSGESAVAGKSKKDLLRVLAQSALGNHGNKDLNSQNKALKSANKALRSALAELSAE